jgi:HlyD family type I secretion membrane fusion protein
MHHRPTTSLRQPLLAGAATALAFFVGFGTWAATAPLAGAAVAPAVVVPDGSRKTVQHLEGGIVRRILVRDGDRVAAGHPLVELDETRTLAEHAALLADWRALAAAEARLVAEQAGAEEVRFPKAILTARADPTVARLLEGELKRFMSRARALADQEAVLRERIRQSEAEIAGHQAEIRSAERQIALILEEIGTVKILVKKGIERKPRLLALERSWAQIEGARATAQAAVARAKQTIGEAQQQITALRSERAEGTANELADTRRELAQAQQKLAAAADKLARITITAPVAGTVVDLKLKTPGGVVGAGDPLLDLVPLDDTLVLEARVAPVDIDEVHAGLRAQVHLLAYKSRNLPRIDGTVREVSADRLADTQTGQPYYKARIALPTTALPPGVSLAPGMPAEALIITAERTFLNYLIQPLKDAFRRGLRES